MASWHRRFMNDMATIAEPLTKKNRKYEWTEEQQAAFDQVKVLLATAPVLQSPRFDQEFVI